MNFSDRRKNKILFLLIFSLLVVFTVFPVTTHAAVKKKTVKVSRCDFSQRLPSLPALKKKICYVSTGRTRLKVKTGFVAFTAKKSGRYTFTFSNLTGAGLGSVSFLEKIPLSNKLEFIDDSDVRTKNGYNSVLWLCSKEEAIYYNPPKETSTGSTSSTSSTGSTGTTSTAQSAGSEKSENTIKPVEQWTGSIRLSKGDTIYLYMEFSKKKYSKVTLKVAKK